MLKILGFICCSIFHLKNHVLFKHNYFKKIHKYALIFHNNNLFCIFCYKNICFFFVKKKYIMGVKEPKLIFTF